MKKKRNSSDSNGVTAPLLDSSDNPENENEERVIQPFILPDPEEELDPYPPNIIITSRYTVFSFLPKTIFEQFRRLANVYFLVLGMIAAIGANTEYYDTAVEPAGLLIPMTIVVFISILKDGVEDIKRHQTDQKTNNRHCRLVQQNVCFNLSSPTFPFPSSSSSQLAGRGAGLRMEKCCRGKVRITRG
jgi:hypothetical protein